MMLENERHLQTGEIYQLNEPVTDEKLDMLIDAAKRNGAAIYEWAGKIAILKVEQLNASQEV